MTKLNSRSIHFTGLCKMKTHIILASVANSEIERVDLENIEELEFETLEDLQKTLKTTDFELYTLSDFVDLWNNEEVDPDEYWIGYVNLDEEGSVYE